MKMKGLYKNKIKMTVTLIVAICAENECGRLKQ